MTDIISKVCLLIIIMTFILYIATDGISLERSQQQLAILHALTGKFISFILRYISVQLLTFVNSTEEVDLKKMSQPLQES